MAKPSRRSNPQAPFAPVGRRARRKPDRDDEGSLPRANALMTRLLFRLFSADEAYTLPPIS